MNQLSTDRIQKIFVGLKPIGIWSFRNVGRTETNAFTHSYHRYPAKFIPQIVQKLINEFAPDKNQIICDPFGGCGTTLIEAKLLGHKSIGFDINPIAKLITQAKLTAIKPKTLENSKNKFLKYYSEKSLNFSAHHPRINYWFDDQTIQELDQIYFAIRRIKNYKVRRFFLCAFSHNLKNCSRWLMKSIKPTIDKNKTIPSPIKLFLNHLDLMIEKNNQFFNILNKSGNIDIEAKMYRRDSTKRLPLKNCSIDLIITSPPYVTSYEYADLHQLSLLWFGDDPKNFKKWHRFSNEFSNFRKNFIGTGSKQQESGNFNSKIAQEIVNKLSQIKNPLAVDVANYFLDMKKVFSEMYRILKPEGKTCIIIGNTNLGGIDILNAQVAVEQMQSLGLKGVEFIKREIFNKLITPWRDSQTGKFTNPDNPDKKRVYQYEYIVVMEKN